MRARETVAARGLRGDRSDNYLESRGTRPRLDTRDAAICFFDDGSPTRAACRSLRHGPSRRALRALGPRAARVRRRPRSDARWVEAQYGAGHVWAEHAKHCSDDDVVLADDDAAAADSSAAAADDDSGGGSGSVGATTVRTQCIEKFLLWSFPLVAGFVALNLSFIVTFLERPTPTEVRR